MSDPNPTLKLDYGRNTNRADVLIIGAGLSGMATAIEMIRKGNGRNFIIVEKGNQIGGTWNDQRYPGCCCDVWSHLYSLSFEPNPNWTREYPGQEEILDYLIDVAHKYQLYRHIRFNTAVEESRWDDESKVWKTKLTRLNTKDAEFGSDYIVTSNFLVSAVGQLNTPNYPDIKGLNSFVGKVMHSARWDWDYDVTDKRIAIIGNGATAAQIVPEIAKVCQNLVIFQRTPNWVINRDDKPISTMMQSIYRNVPFVRSRYRASLMDFRESFFDCVFDAKSDMAATMMNISKHHMLTQLPGEEYAELREKLQPKYALGCKRVIISDNYFPTFKQDNVTLETSKLEEITTKGAKIQGEKEHEFDLLILATGFKTTQFMYPIKVYGLHGKSLEAIWNKGAAAYLGITVPDLPNFGMLYGPNTNLGHNSIILMIEAQALYINALISKVKQARGFGHKLSIRPRDNIVKEYNKWLQSRLETSAFSDPKCNSWYKNEAGLITNNWADNCIQYQEKTSQIDWREFQVEGDREVVERINDEGRVTWRRTVEETQISNSMLLTGIVAAFAIGIGTAFRHSLREIVRV